MDRVRRDGLTHASHEMTIVRDRVPSRRAGKAVLVQIWGTACRQAQGVREFDTRKHDVSTIRVARPEERRAWLVGRTRRSLRSGTCHPNSRTPSRLP